MGWFGPQSGSCGCCGSSSCACDLLSFITISGLTGPCSACVGFNGTYVFRSSPGGCFFSNAFDSYNCQFEPAPIDIYIGFSIAPCSTTSDSHGYGVGFSIVGGKLRIQVVVTITATENSLGLTNTTGGTTASALFQADFDTCADAVGASIPLFSVTESDCRTGTGDYCNVASATVTIG